MSSSGTVKFFNDAKGFGFITPADGSEDLFVHATGITDGNSLSEGDQVYYSSEYDDRKGKYRAGNVSGGSGGPLGSGGKGGGYGGGKGGGYGGGYDGGYGGGFGGGKGGGKGVCRQWQAGSCSYGNSCRFSHS